MKKFITLLFLAIAFLGYSQDDIDWDKYKIKVAWKTKILNVQYVNTDTFTVDVVPTDNDPGTFPLRYGNYLMDVRGLRYEIIDTTNAPNITVVDILGANYAPFQGESGFVYLSAGNGDSPSLPTVNFEQLEKDALQYGYGVDMNIIWDEVSKKLENPVDSITFKDINYLDNFTSYTFKRDTANRTIVMTNDESEISMQLGFELWLEIKNGNGVTFENGALVYIIEGSGNDHPTIMLADNRDFETVDAVGMITHDVEAGTFGFTTVYGDVHDLPTLGTTEGQKVYVDTIGGVKNWTTTIPSFPAHEFEIGYITKVHATEGSIFINPKGQIDDILHNINNANMIEPFDFRVTSNGTVVTGTLTDAGGKDYITVKWSDGFEKISVPITIEIPQGTDNDSQTSFAYLRKSTSALAISTTYFPLEEEVKTIAKLNTWTAAKTLAKGQKGNQNYNDYIAKEGDGGRISQIGKWQRWQPLKYITGGIGSVSVLNVAGKDSVKFSMTSSIWTQANEQMFPEYDMDLGDDIHVLNYPDHADTTVTNIADLLIDATGSTMAGKSFTYVIWIVQNKTGDASHVFINLPNGSYSSESSALTDALGYKVKDIPYIMQSYSGFVYELTMTHTNPGGGTWSTVQLKDIKGDYPFGGGGSGGNGGGITALTQALDFPNSYAGFAGFLLTVGALETTTEFIAKSAIDVGDFNDDGTYALFSELHPALTLTGKDYGQLNEGNQVLNLSEIDLTDDVTGVLPDANVADDIILTNITQITNRSHTNLQDKGTNTHPQIDTHIIDGTIHYIQSAISIPANQISDFDTEVSNNSSVVANTAKVSANNPTITIQGTAVEDTPQTFTLNQPGGKTITINTSTGSGGSTGTDTINQTSHGLILEDWVRNNTGSYVKAQGDNAVNADVLGLVSEVISVNSFVYQYAGVYTSGTWVEGTNYFLNVDTEGDSQTEDSFADGEVRVYLGTGVPNGLLLEIDIGTLIEFSPLNFYYEDYLTDAENVIDVGFAINNETLVFLNGNILLSNQHTFASNTLTLIPPILENDILIVWGAEPLLDNYFDKVLTLGENNIDVGFTLNSSTIIFYNGDIILNTLWSGEGTDILNLSLDTNLYDNLIVRN